MSSLIGSKCPTFKGRNVLLCLFWKTTKGNTDCFIWMSIEIFPEPVVHGPHMLKLYIFHVSIFSLWQRRPRGLVRLRHRKRRSGSGKDHICCPKHGWKLSRPLLKKYIQSTKKQLQNIPRVTKMSRFVCWLKRSRIRIVEMLMWYVWNISK